MKILYCYSKLRKYWFEEYSIYPDFNQQFNKESYQPNESILKPGTIAFMLIYEMEWTL